MIKDINDDDLIKIYRAIGIAISESIEKGKDEPNKVAQLTYRIPKNINGLKLTTKGYSLSVGGVFIHQRPYVTFKDSIKSSVNKTVELGDLLLISTVIDSKGLQRRAMLLQAKMFDDLPTSPDNEDQHTLFNQWPAFQYKAKYLQIFNSGKREIKDLDIYSSAKYLLLAKNRLSKCIPICLWHGSGALTAQPTLELSHHTCFVEELLQFVLGDRGKEFVDKSNLSVADIGWSRVVNDLLNEIVNKVTKKMVIEDNKKGTRGSGVLNFGCDLSFLLTSGNGVVDSQVSDSDEPPNDFPPWPEENDNEDGAGISVVEFVLRKD